MEPRRNLFTIGQASEYLGVSIDTLRRWEKRGRIEAFRSPGGHRYYERDDLDKLFGKKYVHMEKPVKEEIQEEELPKVPTLMTEESPPYIPPTPQRIITIPEVSPIQIARRIETPQPENVFVSPVEQNATATVESSHPIVSPPPIPTAQTPSFLVPQLSLLKEPVRDEEFTRPYQKSKGKTKETLQIIVIITILVLVILLAVILAVMMVK